MASINIRSISVGEVTIQSGNGTPNHIATKGSVYIDMSTGIEYINKDGIATWAMFIDSTTGGSFTGGTVSGATFFSGGISATTISATTYLGLPTDVFVSGGTFSAGTASFTNTTGGTFSITGFSTSNATAFTGGTVTGATIFTNGLTANTISATTYLGLPFNSSDYLPLSGGSVFGPTIFSSGVTADTISATSINRVDYVVFNTGTTIPVTNAGTTFFNNTEHSLAYNASINELVTVNMGQQLYTRVYNSSGSQLDKGTVLSVTGTVNNLPSVIKAINNHNVISARPVGLAAENIPNNSVGLVLNNGILSGITLNAFNNGDVLYLSPYSAGTYVATTSGFPFSARTNEIGYVIQTGVTTGKIYVNINNEDSNLSLTDIERNTLESNLISTGTYEFTGITINSPTTINIAPMKGWIVRNTYGYATLPDVISTYYSGGTNVSITNILTADSTYVLINSANTITQQTTFPTPQQRRENIYLGKVNHPNRTSILNINNQADYDVSPMSALRDLWSPIRLINQNISPSPNGSNLSFNTSAGTVWGNGINWHNNQLSPNSVSISAKTPASFFYRTQTGGTSGLVTVIDPTKYDVGGVITSVGGAASARATNQRIYLYPTGVINVLYGQQYYANLTAAVAGVQSESFTPYPNAESTGILIGVLSVRNDIVDDGEYLTNPNYAKFTLVSKFGESFGGTGGLSTTTLQQAYDNSTTPEISINSALGALSVINGTGNADKVTNLFEGEGATNNLTSFIRADGLISGSSLATPSFSANSVGMSASTILGTTVSATTYQNLPFNSSDYLPISGGTVTGATRFTSGLTANTFSATTIYSPTLDDFLYDKFMTNQYAYFLPSDATATYSGLRTVGGTILSVGTVSSLVENPMGILFTTAAAVGSVAGQYGTVIGGSLLSTNFQFEMIRKFRINTNNGNQRLFVGISSLYSSAAPTNVDPLTLINSIGVAKLQSGGTLNFVWNDSTGTASYLDLGSNFLGTATSVTYKLKISKTFGVAAINLELTQVNNTTGAVLTTGTTINSDYNTGVSYYPVAWMGNNTGVSGAVSFKDYGCQLFKRNAISS
jgi:hypothetical protein